jgi:Ca2+-transporting ATPase
MEIKWHLLSAEEVMKNLGTSESGLSGQEARERLKKFGLNELKERKKVSPVKIFLRQFKSFLIAILLVAAILSFFLKEFLDAFAILAVLLMNAFLGFVQEYRAEKAIEALKKIVVQKVRVIREGKITEIPSKELVPGDIIVLEEGEVVPADARIIEEFGLATDESALTGESTPVQKQVVPIQDLPLAERKNMLFMGTYVSRGKGKAVVVETGMSTEFGKIAKEIEEKEELTPLQKKLDKFGKWLGMIVLFICGLVFTLGYFKSINIFEVFFTAVALAVSAVPEGLPAIVTVALALGVSKMAKRNALVRRLSAVETLGCTTVICSDKTGTMTMNEMCVRKVWFSNRQVEVTGLGFEPKGEFFLNGEKIEPSKEKDLILLIKAGLFCNSSTVEFKEGKWHVVGDPTEGSLVVLASKAELAKEKRPEFEIPFSSERKLMTTVYKEEEYFVYTKGAPEKVLPLCSRLQENGKARKLTEEDKKIISSKIEEMAKEGLRVLALAYKKMKKFEESKAEKDLIFLGLVGIIDPPRKEVKEAIEKCKQAGIKPVMVTGDHKLTATAIAKEIGLMEEGEEVLTGEEIESMGEEELEERIEKISVYARVAPEQKLRIVKAFKKKGHVVAVTGDGINDAPALKRADIGVAMGIKGTDVAKEASDMVLLDDNFATIVNAVEEGRGIYDNIRKFVRFLLGVNFAEIALITVSILLGLPLPLLPLQILWINLVTDGLPALALSADPYEKDLMKRKPRNPKHDILHGMLLFILIATLVNLLAEMLIFIWGLSSGYSLEKVRTMVFSTAVFFELFFVLNCRSENKSVFKKGISDNKKLLLALLASFILQLLAIYFPPFQQVFKTVALEFRELLIILAISASSLFVLPEIFMNRDLKFKKVE